MTDRFDFRDEDDEHEQMENEADRTDVWRWELRAKTSAFDADVERLHREVQAELEQARGHLDAALDMSRRVA